MCRLFSLTTARLFKQRENKTFLPSDQTNDTNHANSLCQMNHSNHSGNVHVQQNIPLCFSLVLPFCRIWVCCACQNRGLHSVGQNMALTMRLASALRTLSLQHRLQGKQVALISARGVHFSYVPDSPNPSHGKNAEVICWCDFTLSVAEVSRILIHWHYIMYWCRLCLSDSELTSKGMQWLIGGHESYLSEYCVK